MPLRDLLAIGRSRRKPKRPCFFCGKSVGKSPALFKYKYLHDGEHHIGEAEICNACADTLDNAEKKNGDKPV